MFLNCLSNYKYQTKHQKYPCLLFRYIRLDSSCWFEQANEWSENHLIWIYDLELPTVRDSEAESGHKIKIWYICVMTWESAWSSNLEADRHIFTCKQCFIRRGQKGLYSYPIQWETLYFSETFATSHFKTFLENCLIFSNSQNSGQQFNHTFESES